MLSHSQQQLHQGYLELQGRVEVRSRKGFWGRWGGLCCGWVCGCGWKNGGRGALNTDDTASNGFRQCRIDTIGFNLMYHLCMWCGTEGSLRLCNLFPLLFKPLQVKFNLLSQLSVSSQDL